MTASHDDVDDAKRIMREFYAQYEVSTIFWLPVDPQLYRKVQSYVNIVSKKRLILIAMTIVALRTLLNVVSIVLDPPDKVKCTVIFAIDVVVGFIFYAVLVNIQLKNNNVPIRKLHYTVAIAGATLVSIAAAANSITLAIKRIKLQL
ncbi:hypothetical protein HDU76_005694 [Blyttiomyces sp. JEL0837]|nr:hypothetical protein HDU76_005694 [Blyttiomyces sp. JEL0837]